jgi:hypothetical protein
LRAWNILFHTVLIGLGFTHPCSDAGVYVYHLQDGEGIVIIILYIDDIILLSDSSKEISRIKVILSNQFEMTDLGEIESYLGVWITQDRLLRTLKIDQSCYICEIIECFGMADSNPVCMPLPAGAETHLIAHTGEASSDEIKYYQKIIGSLLYVQIGMHLDISFAVTCLLQYASNPSPQHLCLAKYILSYLKGTADLRIWYDGMWGDRLHGYSDSSLGDQLDDYHSMSGYIYLLADGAISWTSRKQKTVAQSTTEVEYMVLAEASNQAVWYCSYLTELSYETLDSIPLHGNNKGTVDLALNPMTGRRSKHIPIKHHAIHKYVEDGVIDLVRTPLEDMLVDRMTKSLAYVRLRDLATGLELSNQALS